MYIITHVFILVWRPLVGQEQIGEAKGRHIFRIVSRSCSLPHAFLPREKLVTNPATPLLTRRTAVFSDSRRNGVSQFPPPPSSVTDPQVLSVVFWKCSKFFIFQNKTIQFSFVIWHLFKIFILLKTSNLSNYFGVSFENLKVFIFAKYGF